MTPKRTPFYEVGVAAGAEMRDLFGYWLPWEYSPGHVEEHIATRSKVTVCDLDYMAEFRIVGPRALEFLNYLLTNSFSDLAIGQVRYTAMVSEGGTMVDDGTVWRLGEEEFVLITGNPDDQEWVRNIASQFDVQVTDETATWTTLAVQGPNALALTSAVASDVAVGSLRYYRFVRSELFGVDCIVARMGYTGERGYEFHLPPAAGVSLWESLFELGGDMGVLPCGQAALESLRQEAGYLLVGNDHDSSTNPFEAGIGRTVKLEKSDFVGKEALQALRRSGVSRTMTWLKLDGPDVPLPGDQVEVDGERVGTVTSGSYSPTQRRGVAMAYLRPAHSIPGLRVDVRSSSGQFPATVSIMPLFDPGDVRTRGA